jgi:hypothetical protein
MEPARYTRMVYAQDLDWDKWQAPVHDKRLSTPRLISAGASIILIAPACWATSCRTACCLDAGHGQSGVSHARGFPGHQKCPCDATQPGNPERDVPEQVEILAEFPSGMTMVIVVSTVNARSPGFTIYGHKASLEIGSSGERIELIPEKDFPTTSTCKPSTACQADEDIGAGTRRRIGLTASAATSSPMPASIWPFAPRPSFPWRKCPTA